MIDHSSDNPSELPGLRRDFDRINASLAAMVASVQQDLQKISPWMGLLDRIGGRTQTELIRFNVVTARTGAWRFATELVATPESTWHVAIEERDRRVARVGEYVLHPGAWMSAGLVPIRLRERGDVAANLPLLLDAEEPSFETIDSLVEDPSPEP